MGRCLVLGVPSWDSGFGLNAAAPRACSTAEKQKRRALKSYIRELEVLASLICARLAELAC